MNLLKLTLVVVALGFLATFCTSRATAQTPAQNVLQTLADHEQRLREVETRLGIRGPSVVQNAVPPGVTVTAAPVPFTAVVTSPITSTAWVTGDGSGACAGGNCGNSATSTRRGLFGRRR